MKKEIFVNGRHDYNLTVDGNTYTLLYSSDEAWTRPNTVVMSVTDTGDDYKFNQLKKGILNYSESVELNILLKVIYLLRDEKFEIVDTKIEL